jgi:hypothetical protein
MHPPDDKKSVNYIVPIILIELHCSNHVSNLSMKNVHIHDLGVMGVSRRIHQTIQKLEAN